MTQGVKINHNRQKGVVKLTLPNLSTFPFVSRFPLSIPRAVVYAHKRGAPAQPQRPPAKWRSGPRSGSAWRRRAWARLPAPAWHCNRGRGTASVRHRRLYNNAGGGAVGAAKRLRDLDPHSYAVIRSSGAQDRRGECKDVGNWGALEQVRTAWHASGESNGGRTHLGCRGNDLGHMRPSPTRCCGSTHKCAYTCIQHIHDSKCMQCMHACICVCTNAHV